MAPSARSLAVQLAVHMRPSSISMSSSSHPNIPFSQFQDVFDAALREYRRRTGKDIVTDPLSSALTARLLRCENATEKSDAVLEVLQEQAHAFDQFRNGDWKVQLMRQLKPTVDILLGLSTSGVFGEGIGLRLPPAQAIFAGVGLLLAAARGVSTSYDALIELFECFEHYLGRLRVLTEIPSAVGEIMVKIMVELLEVLGLATQQIKQGRFKKFAKKLLGENDIEAVLQRLDRLTVEESRVTATQTMEVVYGLFNNMKVVMEDGKASINNIQEALVTMQTIWDGLNKMKCDRLREKIQKWLSPPDPSVNHNTACDAHHIGTAAWFLESPIYAEWKATGSLLWTHGNPGSGKSILCSSIIKDIESIRATGLASVAYYYFDFKDTGNQDRRGLLSSLLIQLCTRSHHGYDTLSNLYEAHENGLRQPSEVDLIRCLKKVLKLPGRVYIVVDAVDESPNKPGIPSPREKVLQLMKELVDLRRPDTRVCITSRPEVDIRMVLGPLASHTVSLHDERGQTRDIINYIESVVQSDANIQKWRPEDRQLVIDSLSQKANGMFRWVVCQLDTLRRCFPASIRRALNKLPMTLDETYEQILLGIDREKSEHAIRLLKCLAFSRWPLRVKELAEVLSIQFDTAIPRLDTSLRPIDADEAVLSACSTLVTIIEPDNPTIYSYDVRVVQFSHYSVKEYLTSERLAKSDKEDLSQYYISREPAHTILAQSCIGTLLQPDLHTQNITNNFPLAYYAAQNWFHHAQCDGVASRIQDGMERLFDPNGKHLAIWISIYDIDHCVSWSHSSRSPLYYAALCGIGSLVEHLIITRQQDPNESHGRQGTTLHAAVVSGHTTIVRLLLGLNADVNARDLDAAVRSGNFDIMQLLLSHGADVNAFDHQGNVSLHNEARSQKPEDLELILKGYEDMGMSNPTLLHVAARGGNLYVAQWLLSHGADVNSLDHQGYSPLHIAVRLQKLDVVELLLKGGADLNTLGHRGDSPLHKAVQSQNLEVVELLLKGGAAMNTWNSRDRTPLLEATSNGNLDIAQLLLNHGADVNTLSQMGNSPLHEAVRSQNLDMVGLLLKVGVDVNVQSMYRPTPLHEAAGSGSIDIVQLMLSHGADVNTLSLQGDSPLHKALQSQNIDHLDFIVSGEHGNASHSQYSLLGLRQKQQRNYATVQLLLRHGADVNARGCHHKTPLHMASLGGSLDVSRLLIEQGADVNAQDNKGQTPFSIALIHKHRKLARFLSNDRVPPERDM